MLAVITFLPALHNGLLGDDPLLLEARLDESHAQTLSGFFVESYWGDLHDSGLYRPLSLALLNIQHRAFGLDAAAYRLVNLVIHGLCSVLVLLILSTFAPQPAALAGAVLFAVHPIHAEAVTMIYGQQDMLAALFFLAALLVSVQTPSIRSGDLLLIGCFYLLSLLSKEQGVLLPLLIRVVRSQLGLTGRQSQWGIDSACLIALVIYAGLRIGALGSTLVPTGESSVVFGYPVWARINLVVVTVGTYLRLLVLPWGQTTYYGHLRDSLFGWPVTDMAVILAAIALVGPLERVLGRAVVRPAYAFVAATLFPVANIVPIGVVVAERCLYLPAFAVSLIAAGALSRSSTLQTRRTMTIVASVLAVIGISLSARVAIRWRTPLAHWESTALDHPRSAGAQARFALLLLHQAAADGAGPDDPRLARAEDAIERASEINRRLPEAWHARGALAIMRRDCAAASAALDRALALRPGDREISALRRTCP